MGGDCCLALEQGDVLDEQTQDALTLGRGNAGVVPDAGELFGEFANAAARFVVQRGGLLLGPPIAFGGGIAVDA